MTVEIAETVVVGLGQLYVKKSPSILVCLGLGSCIALSAYDPSTKAGGMAHIVLPDGTGRTDQASPKYATSAVPLLLSEMERQGANRSRIVIRMSGGAKMAGTGALGAVFKIGESNIEATRKALADSGITRIAGADVGGSHGRTVKLWLDTGRLAVTASNREQIEL
ncbi:MAG: chemotaxis protein CheD [Chloroflexi bacterium]|nr:chemotaxis protein CheD [Chloroflexota bacterium]